MKFDCGLTYAEKVRAQAEWHRWFAWRPVRVDSRDCRWLEYVERRIEIRFGLYNIYRIKEYRKIETPSGQ